MGGKDDSAVRQAVKRFEARMRKDRKLVKFYAALEKEMSNFKM
jgi:truncated hemoglobin YjbI